MHKKLTWSLTICTYNRAHFLTQMLDHALAQTRLPKEIVIVDASDNWEEVKADIKERFKSHWEQIALIHVPASVRSLTYQRNQALDLASGDIVFSLDDDIYLYPDAAEIIMCAYEADTSSEIAMIAGHFTEGPYPPATQQPASGPSATTGGLRSWFEGQLTLDSHFVAYGPKVDMSPAPASVEGLRIYPCGLVNGGRTTFRRKFGLRVRWSELLKYYATHEDGDFSYRMSLQGRLLVAPDAGFFHADGNDSNFKRFRVNTIRVRNLIALHRIHSPNRARSAIRLAGSFLWFMLIYLMIDAAQKRFGFPTVRAYVYGLLHILVFLFFPFQNFHSWYLQLQERMYGNR